MGRIGGGEDMKIWKVCVFHRAARREGHDNINEKPNAASVAKRHQIDQIGIGCGRGVAVRETEIKVGG